MFLNQELVNDVRVKNDLTDLQILAYGIDENQPCKATDLGGRWSDRRFPTTGLIEVLPQLTAGRFVAPRLCWLDHGDRFAAKF